MPYRGLEDIYIVLRSIVFLLVMISLVTTPTSAYEAYNISNLIVLKQQQLIKEQELNNLAQQPQKFADDVHDLCALAAVNAQKDYNIKPHLLNTIASVESGRWVEERGKRVAWPWTVQANGHGHYYKTKEEAVNAVKKLQQAGINNIDVGCMQINLKYHGKAFSSVEEALDPAKNVAYSARFLRELYERNGRNWQKTAMQYHSKNYAKGLTYKKRLEQHFAEFVAPLASQTLF